MANVISVLGKSFADATFVLAGAGLNVSIPTPTLVLAGQPGSTPQAMTDSTVITCDDNQDLADSDAPTLTAPYILSQQPPPGTSYDPNSLRFVAVNALGYSVPTPFGTIPVP